ncbi:class F sortase [Actinoplanes sp. NPDC049316]|uniref:class F sortase n=1 Tax=Actinoplanes sp. NPDC049316 TaxID=3154727 RepID=UPI00341BB83F
MAAGVTLLAVFGVVACRSRTAPDVGTATVTALVSPSDRPLAPAVAASVPVSDGRPARDAGAGAPARLRVPALELDAPVAAVGIDPATGEVDVPEDVGRVGWYRFGPGLSATAGSIVVAGHVDSARQGRGAFFRLGSLTPGDRVTLTGPGGASRDFEVVARERYAKTAIPLQRYFARDGSPRLTLITCGGPFDAATRHYRDNVVVTAVPR